MLLSYKHFILTGFVFLTVRLAAQVNPLPVTIAEDSIHYYMAGIIHTRNDNEKRQFNHHIIRLFESILKQPASLVYPFDSLKMIGRLMAPDQSFRLITWNISFEQGTFEYFGFIQYLTGKDKVYHYKPLIEKTDEITNPENSVLSASKWYGGLYYKILQQKISNRNYYITLALQFHDKMISRKFIEVMYFDEWGNPVFGAPLLHGENDKLKHRLVFQYSANLMMSLRYDEKMDMIIFDHLSPNESRYAGDYEFYGPDLSFDGLKFKKNGWYLQTKLDMRNPERPSR